MMNENSFEWAESKNQNHHHESSSVDSKWLDVVFELVDERTADRSVEKHPLIRTNIRVVLLKRETSSNRIDEHHR